MSTFEFHVSRRVRERYQFAHTLFSFDGNVVFTSLSACREFAHRMNQVREAEGCRPDERINAAALYAMGLIDEACHALIASYRREYYPQVMSHGLDWLRERFSADEVDHLLTSFVTEYPGQSVYRGQQTPTEWLAGATDGLSHREIALEEMLLLSIENRNPAFAPFAELFNDEALAEQTIYRQATASLPEYFKDLPLIPVEGAQPADLLHLLLKLSEAAPDSLRDQLSWIRKYWRALLGAEVDRLLGTAGEVLHEEELALWRQFHPTWDPTLLDQARAQQGRHGGGPISESAVPIYGTRTDAEYERFSQDIEWMPQTVLMAKSTYVWLAQLSRFYGRAIERLDQIPEEELDALARRGMTGLWLIGLWERSRASRTIKQFCGNADAVASAYSLFDYRIADDLGGESAYDQLRERAARRGIRLASDMVANHMGIDSPWVVEHPDWFLSRTDSPYPNYSFEGPDLSADGRVEIQIERHYYDQSDAAVVFRRRDRASGEVRYIYHGNDGTSFPWNDTAQLNYLHPEVREHLIQTILAMARKFPIIRFDAAMTLAKRHFHRLWFPAPGASGAIPSRAEYSMSDEEFDRAMPHEFWREVVDRVAAEVPGTLLLAEAFWLMEGYFVRTLGMHRVYNSAFMNMLRDEENAKYRSVIKNTIEFDPDILKRYVNFMSNPDERTAIDQFGSGDKCYGVTTLMATLPGLPMFGHGQVEGFTEKYGMEYRRPRLEENADPWQVERFERQIAPLLEHRSLFAESSHFLLYDLNRDDGSVDENVFAYSNRRGDERALVVYHNCYAATAGWLNLSAPYADKAAGESRRQSIAEGLGLADLNLGVDPLLSYRDATTGLTHLRRANEIFESGLRLQLAAYECHVWLDWKPLYATPEQPWDRLCDELAGQGVANLHEALLDLLLAPVHQALSAILVPEQLSALAHAAEQASEARLTAASIVLWPVIRKWIDQTQLFLDDDLLYRVLCGEESKLSARPRAQAAATSHRSASDRSKTGSAANRTAEQEKACRTELLALLRMPWLKVDEPVAAAAGSVLPQKTLNALEQPTLASWAALLGWYCCEIALRACMVEGKLTSRCEGFDRLRLRVPLAAAFERLGLTGEAMWRAVARVRQLLRAEDRKPEADAPVLGLTETQWQDAEMRWLLGWNEWEGHTYLNREFYEQTLAWLMLPSKSLPSRLPDSSPDSSPDASAVLKQSFTKMETLGYCVDSLLASLSAQRQTVISSQVSSPQASSLQQTSKAVCLRRSLGRKAVDRHRKHRKKKRKH